MATDYVEQHMRRTMESYRAAGMDDKADRLQHRLDLAGAPVRVPALEPVSEDPEPEAFDPSKHSVAAVQEYLLGLPEDEVAAVLAAERAGKNRPTLVGRDDDNEGDDD